MVINETYCLDMTIFVFSDSKSTGKDVLYDFFSVFGFNGFSIFSKRPYWVEFSILNAV